MRLTFAGADAPIGLMPASEHHWRRAAQRHVRRLPTHMPNRRKYILLSAATLICAVGLGVLPTNGFVRCLIRTECDIEPKSLFWRCCASSMDSCRLREALVLLTYAVPPFLRARSISATNYCISALRQIDAAKQEWALRYHKSTNDIPSLNDLQPIILPGETNEPLVFVCPKGGTYTIGRVDEAPKCSFPGHALPQ